MSFSAPQAVSILRLDSNLTTTELFSHLANMPWSILLDSANANHCDSRFDIICVDPIVTLVTSGLETKIETLSKEGIYESTTSSLNPLDIIKQQIAHYFPEKKQSPLPFSGGAIGCFNYDLGRHIETLPVIAQDDIQLADMHVGLYRWAVIFDYKTGEWNLVHYGSESDAKKALEWLKEQLSSSIQETPFKLDSEWQPQITKNEYIEKFNHIQEYLHSGDCYQINLTQRFSADYHGNEWQAYLALRDTNKAPFSAFIRVPQATVLSISPERFIQLKGKEIQTKPIKGTSPRHANLKDDKSSALKLQASTKDRAENLMIVDLLRNDLGKVAEPGSVSVPHLFEIESFPAVHHLVSTVTAKLSTNYQATDLLKAAFPGGSITGAPKIRAMEIIEELEPSRRSLYCGSIGYISQDGQMDSSITIRTLIAKNNQIHCWAGGGIVADSTAENEYQESYDKVSKILPVLQT
ncbi:aminodeoxychorismate synthase component I [Shewanella sp. UCD-KL12]|uniref:aminodeoxychorismate synthase component I n=1 Tax=Shewanella sp. UCD-KL12 TaxID=1917163 RepID=UPI0009712FF6|nr:aminodeoxychorismate synthase component I [Shewanella sp. UCD-KL12]